MSLLTKQQLLIDIEQEVKSYEKLCQKMFIYFSQLIKQADNNQLTREYVAYEIMDILGKLPPQLSRSYMESLRDEAFKSEENQQMDWESLKNIVLEGAKNINNEAFWQKHNSST